MDNNEQVIDGKWRVLGLCSNAGGMGMLLFVTSAQTPGPRLVLKICKQDDPEIRARFRREVRVMQLFAGDAHVVQVVDANPDHDPPYFVMPYFERGDLMQRSSEFRHDYGIVEQVFDRMMACIGDLHQRHVIHRDIKPQNFLVGNDTMVVSDFGLCCEHESQSALTRSSQAFGTQGYIPPEFYAAGGFRDADARSDIFMLGKSMYAILTGHDPTYMLREGIPPQLWVVIQRACANEKLDRYPSLAALSESIKVAFDSILGRVVGGAGVRALLESISTKLDNNQPLAFNDVVAFLDQLEQVEVGDKRSICLELKPGFFWYLAQPQTQDRLRSLLATYRDMAAEAEYTWSFAETIADGMKVLFNAPIVSGSDKAEALNIAIIAAVRQNRFNALDTCRAMIASVSDPELDHRVHEILRASSYEFVASVDPNTCRAPAIRAATRGAQQWQAQQFDPSLPPAPSS